MSKKGGFTDIFLFMIIAFIIIVVSGIMIFLSAEVKTQLHSVMDNMTFSNTTNTSLVIDETFGHVNSSFQALYWIAWFLIGGMSISIFIGSYLVTTRPVFFIPYFIITIVAVIIAVVISNSYETLMATPDLATTFAGFTGANFIMSKLPIWVSVISVIGAVIMFSRMGSKENEAYYV